MCDDYFYQNDSPDVDDPDATINIDKKLRPHVYAVESSDHDVSHLPGATQLDPHVQSLSDSILNVTTSNRSNVMEDSLDKTSYGDETVVDEELILTQLESIDDKSDSDDDVDEELVDMLADLATEAKESEAKTGTQSQSTSNNNDDLFKTPKSIKSQSQHSSQGSGRKLSKAVAEALEEEEEQESLEMSQVVWDTTEAAEDDEWDQLDKTLMENFAKDLEPETCDDMEDMFK